MRVGELLKKKQENLTDNQPVTIAFLGDSVTQGCFECYIESPNTVQTVFDYKSAYSTRLKEILNLLYPSVQINVINSGISGDSAPSGYTRLERDILSSHPDLVIVSYGLNDSGYGMEGMETYKTALKNIFQELKANGVEIIFLTQNYMNTTVSPHLHEPLFLQLAENFSKIQNAGILKAYFGEAKKLCEEYGIPVCDMYPVWEKMEQSGVNVTELLANKFNHPIREFHYYIAIKLIEAILLES